MKMPRDRVFGAAAVGGRRPRPGKRIAGIGPLSHSSSEDPVGQRLGGAVRHRSGAAEPVDGGSAIPAAITCVTAAAWELR